jgi:hypothetical protein
MDGRLFDPLLKRAGRTKIAASAMRATPLRTLSRQRLAWLLWFALLLPVAQAAAVCHTYSHLGANGDVEGKQALHSAHCDLCLSAASLGGGALPATEQVIPDATAGLEAPQAAAIGLAPAAALPVYRSRAPPDASR